MSASTSSTSAASSSPSRSSPPLMGKTRSSPISLLSPLPTPRSAPHCLVDVQEKTGHRSPPRKRKFSQATKNGLNRGGESEGSDLPSNSSLVRRRSRRRNRKCGVEAERAEAANGSADASLASSEGSRHQGRRYQQRNVHRRGKRERINLPGPRDVDLSSSSGGGGATSGIGIGSQKNGKESCGDDDIVVLDDDSDDGGGKLGPASGPIEVLELSDDDGADSSEIDLTGTAAKGSRVASWRERFSFGQSNDDGVVIVPDGQSTATMAASSSESSSSAISIRKRRRDQIVSTWTAAAASSTGAANESAGKEPEETKDTPFSRILEFFPDLDPAAAERMLRDAGIRDDAVRASVPMPHGTDPRLEGQIQSVVSRLLDGGAQSYPKRIRVDDKDSAAVGANRVSSTKSGHIGATQALDVVSRPEEARRPYLHDYTSTSSFDPTEKYKVQCSQRLAAAIPFLSVKGIELLLAKCNGRYSFVYKLVCDAVLGLGENEKKGGDANDLSEEEVRRLGRRHKRLELLLKGDSSLLPDEATCLKVDGRVTTLRRPRRGKNGVPPIGPADADEVLTDEVRYASDALADRSAEVQTRADRLRARRASKKTGSVFECGCCFSDDLAFEEMVSCRNEGHLFCVDCVRRHAEERVFGLGSLEEGGQGSKGVAAVAELHCMHGDCGSGFPRELLKKALPAKVMKKYEELQAKAALGKAAVEDLCTCPKCDFQAVLPATERIFRCPVEGCQYESCRECGEPPHIPLRCEEVEKKNETEGRRTVEEAMTEARVRTCPRYPKCRNRFYKTDGCNKMTCPPPCGAFVCYICRQEIPRDVGYAHYCQTPHCTHERCKKCPLYSNAKEDDLRATKEAGLKAAEEVRQKSRAENGEGTGTRTSASTGGNGGKNGKREVNVDVDALLRDPQQSRRQGPGNAALAVVPPRHVAWAHPRVMIQQVPPGVRAPPGMHPPPAMHPHPHIGLPRNAPPALVIHPPHPIPRAHAIPVVPVHLDRNVHARFAAQAQRVAREAAQREIARQQGNRR